MIILFQENKEKLTIMFLTTGIAYYFKEGGRIKQAR